MIISLGILLLILVVGHILPLERRTTLIFISIWGGVTVFLQPIPIDFGQIIEMYQRNDFIEMYQRNFLAMSIAATVMIGIGILIRYLAMNRLPKWTFLMIWGVVSIRLLFPFTLQLPQSEPTVAAVNIIAREIILEQLPTQIIQATDVSPSHFEYIFFFWLIGAVLTATYFIIAHYRFRVEMASSLPVENQFIKDWISEQKMWRTVAVRYSDKVSSPLTYGIFRPVIVIPKKMNWADEQSLRYVLAHEFTHIKRFDYGVKIIFATVLSIHWFNPFVWAMYLLANRDIELSCDEAVLKKFGKKARTTYALTLIHLAEKQNNFSVVYNNFSRHAIEERIKVMKNMKKTSILGAVLAVSLVGGGMLAFASTGGEADVPKAEVPETEVPARQMADTVRSRVTQSVEGYGAEREYETFTTEDFQAMDYDSYRAWADEELARMEASGNYSEEVLALSRQDFEENLARIREGKSLYLKHDGDTRFEVMVGEGYDVSMVETVEDGEGGVGMRLEIGEGEAQ